MPVEPIVVVHGALLGVLIFFQVVLAWRCWLLSRAIRDLRLQLEQIAREARGIALKFEARSTRICVRAGCDFRL